MVHFLSSKEHICITQRHRKQCGDGQREAGERSGWREAKGENGDICNSATVNNKEKKRRMVQRCRERLGLQRPLTCCCQCSCGGINDLWLMKEVVSVKSKTFEHSTQMFKMLMGVESNSLLKTGYCFLISHRIYFVETLYDS